MGDPAVDVHHCNQALLPGAGEANLGQGHGYD